MTFRIQPPLPRWTLLHDAAETDFDCHRLGDLFLNVQHLGSLALVLSGPDAPFVPRIDQFGVQDQPSRCVFDDRSTQHAVHT